MKLSDLFPAIDVTASEDRDVLGITADSRKVKPGFVFAALKGSNVDGRDFIEQAIGSGACAILTHDDYVGDTGVPCLKSQDPRLGLATALKMIVGEMPTVMAAVTGTNGKTSVAHFLRQIWEKCGWKSGSLGTLGIVTGDQYRPLAHTTPDPEILYPELAALARNGVDHVVIEASSHGLDQRRLDAVGVKVGGFTNLTRDHLDYHKNFDAYLEAKLGLVDRAIVEDGTIVVNADSEAANAFIDHANVRDLQVITYGRHSDHFKILASEPHSGGQILNFSHRGSEFEVDLPLVGTFQGSNVLCAVGMAVASGVTVEDAVATLPSLQNVPGRMEWAGKTAKGADVFVDFAHTPNALETVLNAARPHTTGRLIVVFGCGGDRDTGKRPEMGKIAADLADVAIVTDDNPRSEDPASIRAQVLATCPGGIDGGDRRSAISQAIQMADQSDLILLAGKGHESGQTIGTETLPFNDRDVVLEILKGEVA